MNISSHNGREEAYVEIEIMWQDDIPSREFTYPTLRIGKSSSRMSWDLLCSFRGGQYKGTTILHRTIQFITFISCFVGDRDTVKPPNKNQHPSTMISSVDRDVHLQIGSVYMLMHD